MNKICFLLISFLFSNFLHAQEDAIERRDFFSLGLGYTGAFSFLNTSEFESFSQRNFNFEDKKIKMPIYQNGIEIMTTIGFIKNVRMGLIYSEGTSQSDILSLKNDSTLNAVMTARLSHYSVNIAYALPIIKSIALIPNLEVGYGSFYLTGSKFSKNIDLDFQQPDNFLKNSNSIEISNHFYYIAPGINLEYSLTPFTIAKISANYYKSISNNWMIYDVVKFNTTQLSSDSFTIKFGIFVGIFNY